LALPSLRTSTDGVLICLRDETLNRTTEGHGPVVELTFALIAAHPESEIYAVDMKADDEAVEIDVVRLA
jgi:glycerophosphoryl diester phosphodiesterase